MTESSLSITDFIARWQQSSASERANCQSFLNELCEVLGVAKPQPAQNKHWFRSVWRAKSKPENSRRNSRGRMVRVEG